tara:strand:- start:177 stop:305 length:129 start_codon:yes stop_codon:yes gene_type:complete
MRALNPSETKTIHGGIVHVIAAGVAAYYGEKVGRWIYKKVFK